LPYRNILVRILEDRTTVVVEIKIIRGREYCDDGGKLLCGRLAVHRVSVDVLVST
jgi:hypothetical protein